MTGYDALRLSAARWRVTGRGLILVTGEDRARLLHAMSTNQVEPLKPGEASRAFFLSAQGRILAEAWIVCREDSLLLDTETPAELLAHLDKYIIADDVVLSESSLTAIAVLGPLASAPAGAFPTAGGFCVYTDDPVGVWDALSALPEATSAEVEVVRLETGRPAFRDVQNYLVQETGQMDAVSFSKGCYLGQEIVERVRSRGAVHKHLKALRVAGSVVPEVGEILPKAGVLTSAAYSERLGQVVAMGYVSTLFEKGDRPMTLADGTQVMLAESA